MSFSSLGLSEAIVRAVAERGYTEPTPIQAQAIPAVLSGGDLLAGAQTGTGKTAGFVLPILQRLSTTQAARPAAAGRRPIRTLILAPTRELAAQVEESVRDYSKYVKVAFFKGAALRPLPPGASKHKNVRYLDIREDEKLDEKQLANWIRQASKLPGWTP